MEHRQGLEPCPARLEDARSFLRTVHGQRGETRTRILHLRRVTLIQLSCALTNVGGRCEDRTRQCRLAGPVSPHCDLAPETGARRQNRTDVTEFAALRLATRQAVPELLERVVGLEPTSSRRQRDVLATGRYPHGVRGRTRTLGINVRSVEPHPWGANNFRSLERAAGIEPA